jgi:ribosomal protein L11 methyltransferase
VPYRIDVPDPPDDALERLVRLGALDIERVAGGLAALMPDSVDAAHVMTDLGTARLSVSAANGRDDGSVWLFSQRPVRAGGVLIVPADMPALSGSIRLSDGPIFGSGLHPTTALCLDVLGELLDVDNPPAILDVGTGSGVLALAALVRGVPRAVGLDIDPDALRVASENARLNGLTPRLRLVRGGPDALRGSWTLVVANVLAAPLIEMASALTRCVAHGGRLVLSGIPSSMASDVERAYRRFGMRQVDRQSRSGWSALVFNPSW